MKIFFESLILAQDERWRRVLGMQVERSPLFSQEKDGDSGKRVRNTLVTCPEVRNNSPKGELIPDVVPIRKASGRKP